MVVIAIALLWQGCDSDLPRWDITGRIAERAAGSLENCLTSL